VVLGSAVYDRAWIPEAAEFVRSNLNALTRLPVWMFSVGMRDALRGPMGALLKNAVPKEIASLRDAIHPRDHHVFSGVIERAQLPLVGRLIFRGLGGRYGDFRNWAEIDAWAEGIARQLGSANRPQSPVQRHRRP
jgi:menaquinone-dependent protoporphyrinogen oxidase